MWRAACLLLALASYVSALSDYELQIDTSNGLSYSITSINQSTNWLKSGKTSVIFRNKGESLSINDGSLKFINRTSEKGRDIIGTYVRTRILWTGNTSINPINQSIFETNFREYQSLGPTYSDLAVVFEQRWPTGATGTSNNQVDAVLSSFPVFEIPDTPEIDQSINQSINQRGVLQWWGPFSQSYVLQPWAVNSPHWPKLEIANGTWTGPLIIFNDGETNQSINQSINQSGPNLASMISPFNSFMDVSIQQIENELHYGLMGTMKYVPIDYSADTIVYLANQSITQTVNRWGEVLLKYYGKSKEARYDEDQVTTNSIGYATDNGAYYYYLTAPNQTYEETIHLVKDEFTKAQFPYAYMQLDSWWYPKGINLGDKSWTANSSIFPNGLENLHKSLDDMKFVAHNRYWAPDVVYAKQNGGAYDWIVEDLFSLPVSQEFWDDLFLNATKWGLVTYEQDWLWTVIDGLKALTETPGLGREWLTQMGRGAEKSSINIQYCMNYPRYLLQSVEIKAVKQARASNDYEPSNEKWNNWEIGLTSILIDALGIAPFKDDFLTSIDEPGNPYNVRGEPFPDFQAAVSTISGGPVWPSSGLTFTNWSLLHRSVRADGKILRGETGAKLPDQSINQYVFGRTSDEYPPLEDNYAMVTHIEVNEGDTHIVGVRPKTTNCSINQSSQKCLDLLHIDSEMSQVTIRSFSAPMSDFDSHLCGWEHFTSSLIVPPLYIVGEREKWVPLSKVRISKWENYNISLIGSINESINWEHMDLSQKPPIRYSDSCQLDERGHGRLDYDLNDLTVYYCNGKLMKSQLTEMMEMCDESYPMNSIDHLLVHKRNKPIKIITADE